MIRSSIILNLIFLFFATSLFAQTPIKKEQITDNHIIVKTGINLRKIYNIDLIKKSVNIDFDIWFKHNGDIDPSKLYFSNSFEKIELKDGYKNINNKEIYERFNIEGKFKINFNEKKFDVTRHLVGFELQSKMIDAKHLKFIIDKEYMDTQSLYKDIKTKSIFEDSSWNIRKVDLYIDHLKVNTLGDLNLAAYGSDNFLESRLNLDIIIDNKTFDPNEFIGLKSAFFVLILSITLLIYLTILKKRIYKKRFLKTIALTKSGQTLFAINDKINFDTIVKISQNLESILKLRDHTNSTKQYVMQISMEMIENMLKHSLNSVNVGYGKKETKGSFSLSYDKRKDTYIIKSCNIIDEQAKFTIEENINALKILDDKELRKLSRQKLRERDSEQTNTGLGFIILLRRSAKPISIKFENIGENIIKFNLEVKV